MDQMTFMLSEGERNPQRAFFERAKRDEELASTAARLICTAAEEGGSETACALIESTLGFLACYGEPHELSFEKFNKLLSMTEAGGRGTNVTPLDLMFKQVREGVYFQKKHHQVPDPARPGHMMWVGDWVTNPGRAPEPDAPCVLRYAEYAAAPASQRSRISARLRMASARLAAWPGYDALCAAMLVSDD